ncbi:MULTISPECIES: DUF7535 family protein [Halococcus]|uniref:Uncharacterized protein n=1 Tax=Halococcus saccharolyticus DSM 5350 TaxID=1227455 RepID=M0MR67_9EURY|nr:MULTISPECIES: hypothetical protein [Halococcus]EMA46950.1 hypothetical protein C449_02919 [Halococcus saccharolyticus DSM 5350]
MSQDESDDPSLPRKALRTVTPPSQGHRDTEMDVIGWSILVGLLIVALPLLPVLVIVWVLTRLFDRGADRATD